VGSPAGSSVVGSHHESRGRIRITLETVPYRCQYLFFLLAISGLLVLSIAGTASAATITPNTFADDNATNGNCTLREAVIAANANAAQDACAAGSGADRIELAIGTYVLSLPGDGEDLAATGDLDIEEDLAVVGRGSAQTTIDGGALDAVFHNDATGGPVGAVSSISEVTIRNGASASVFNGGAITNSELGELTLTRSMIIDSVASASFTGGGIRTEAILTVEQSTISGNEVTGGGSGGGILNLLDGQVTITDSTIEGNTVSGSLSGGGIANLNQGVVSIERSTISGNSATSSSDTSGGGIVNVNTGQLTIRNSTVSDNTAAVSGGGIFNHNQATLSVRSSTVARNSAGTSGGGLFDNTNPPAGSPPTFSVQGSIVAENTAAGAPENCAFGTTSPGIRSDGHNLEDLNTCGFAATGDLRNASAALGPLANNGGSTQTHVPGITSAAIDTGIPDGLTTDQRSLSRTADLSQIPNGAGDGTDIGAVEIQAAVCQARNVPRVDGTGGNDSLTGTAGADAIFALAGDDTASARAGDDCVEGDEGNDILNGNVGNDELFGDGGNDRASGGEGNDDVFGNERKDTIAGNKGRDKLSGGGGKDKLRGGSGRDRLKPGGGKDRINCGGGRDKVNANRNDNVSQNCEKVV
jgi:CSLREA domain-containing protein